MRLRPSVVALAVVILGVAAYLRFTGLGTGLPNRMSRPDEYPVLVATANLSHDPNPHWWVYPPLLVYVTWAWCTAAYHLVPSLSGGLAYPDAVHQVPGGLLLAGRALSATASVATVGLTMWIGSWLGGAAMGLFAGLLVAVNAVVSRDAHAMKADSLLSLALLATIAVALRQRTPGKARDGICLGAAVGAAMGMKYSPAAGLFAYAGAVVGGGPGLRRWIPPARLWVGAAVAAGLFAATSWSIFVEYRKARLDFIAMGAAVWGIGQRPSELTSDVTRWIDPAHLGWQSLDYHLTRSLRLGSGLLTALVLVPALVWALCFAGEKFRFVAVALLIYLALIATSAVRLVRYFSPAVPLVSLVVAGAATRVVDRLAAGRRRSVLLVASAVVLAAEPALRAYEYARVAAREDTRTLASRFLATNLPPGTRVAVLGTGVWPYGEPPLPRGLTRLGSPRDVPATRPGDVVLTHDHTLAFSHVAPGDLERAAPCRTEIARFSPYTPEWRGSLFEMADAYYIPLAGFRGVERPGPVITVWRVEACPGP
jgi:hypothetical protein